MLKLLEARRDAAPPGSGASFEVVALALQLSHASSACHRTAQAELQLVDNCLGCAHLFIADFVLGGPCFGCV